MVWPVSPADGDRHVENGKKYAYNAAANAWLTESSSLSVITGTWDGLTSGDITLPDGDCAFSISSMGWQADGSKGNASIRLMQGVTEVAVLRPVTADQNDFDNLVTAFSSVSVAAGTYQLEITPDTGVTLSTQRKSGYQIIAIGDADLFPSAIIATASLPAASAGARIVVTSDNGPLYSDLTNWRRVSTDAIVV